jgi:hypothetical protein
VVGVSLDADQLYALLPAVYRTRDAAAGGQLRALFGVLAAQSDIVARNIRQLYDDQFIETCDPWVIPYIGDLVGYNSVYELAAVTDTRAEIANTIGYRRRKGTKIALQQAATDVSGRAAVVVEQFPLLITTQSMRYPRPGHNATVSMRNGPGLRLLSQASANGLADSPFDTAASRTIDVRRIAPRSRDAALPDATPLDVALHGGGRANIPNVAIHLWRWQAFEVTEAPAFPVDGAGGVRYKFSPLGNDTPLFSPLRLPASFTALLTRDSVPQPVTRAEFAWFYASGAIALVADGVPVGLDAVCCADLATNPDGTWRAAPPGKIGIDPERGRIQFAADVPVPASLRVSYWYGFPAAIGGGPYDRTPSLLGVLPDRPGFFGVVGSADYPTLESAVAGWNQHAAGTHDPAGVIVVPGITSLTADLTGTAAISLASGASLALVAGKAEPAAPDWNAVAWNKSVVTITGDIEVTGIAGAAPAAGTVPIAGQLLISGIWLAGRLLVSGQAPSGVVISDSTLVPGHGLLSSGGPLHPGEPSVVVTAEGSSVSLNRTISGPAAVAETGSLRITGSVVDATSPYYVAVAGPDLASAGADLHVEDSTLIGKVRARTITLASNSIVRARCGAADPWPAAVWASRTQAGCVRFCSLPADSITPRQYECLPPDSASEAVLAPGFITVRYGDPSYLLLSGDCPMAVWTGADNGSQLGVYHQTEETQAVRNAQIRAPEYLPARLEAGIFLHPSRPPAREEPHAADGDGYGYGQQGYGFTGVGAELV